MAGKDEMPGRAKDPYKCPYSKEGHVFSTFERVINGQHVRIVQCKNCAQRP